VSPEEVTTNRMSLIPSSLNRFFIAAVFGPASCHFPATGPAPMNALQSPRRVLMTPASLDAGADALGAGGEGEPAHRNPGCLPLSQCEVEDHVPDAKVLEA
jgi:hypothetical protein